MAGTITTGSAPKTLWPGIIAFWGQKYNEQDMLYRELFEIKTSSKSYEETPELIGFGLAPVKAEGTSVQYDTWRQGPTTRYTNVPYALGFIVTREEIADNQYAQVARDRTARLAFSMKTTRETVGANIYNRAFTAAFPGGDGSPLIDAAHPTDDGTQSNELTIAAELSEQAIEDMAIQISNANDSRGLRINLRPRKLIIPTSNQFEAERILASYLQNGTANNALNAIRSKGTLPEGYAVNTYLSDPDAWWIMTDAENGMCWFEREATEFSEDNEFDSDNQKYKAYMRFVPGWSDWRGLYGTPGT